MTEKIEDASTMSLVQKIAEAIVQRPVGSPCINVCRLHSQSGYCEGCMRNRDEIKAWKNMADPERLQLLGQLASRTH